MTRTSDDRVERDCVAYCFAYVRRRPKTNEERVAVVARQVGLIQAFGKNAGYKVVRWHIALRGNRNRHFAQTPEFQSAVELAKAMSAPLIVGVLFDLFCVTDPAMNSDAFRTLADCGVQIVDASSGRVFNAEDDAVMVHTARTVAAARRAPITRGISKSKTVKSAAPHNQAKAARGSAIAADRRALRLKPFVDEIRSELPRGEVLRPTLLARKLNGRALKTERGKDWSATTAKALIGRLERLSSSGA